MHTQALLGSQRVDPSCIIRRDMGNRRRTKIICTIGPAVRAKSMLIRLAEEGMDAARLNFSHGTHADFSPIIKDLRDIEKDLGRPIGILADIQGPKFRVGKLSGGELSLAVGQEVWVIGDTPMEVPTNQRPVIVTSYRDFVKDVGPGSTILFDDGLIAMKVTERKANALRCVVVNGGILKENKGINVPEVSFSAPSITEKDYGDILFCMEHGVELFHNDRDFDSIAKETNLRVYRL